MHFNGTNQFMVLVSFKNIHIIGQVSATKIAHMPMVDFWVRAGIFLFLFLLFLH